MRRKKFHRKPYKNTRERSQTANGMNPAKMNALAQLFKDMTGEEIVAELNSTWIDARYQLKIVEAQADIVDGIVMFNGWEVAS